MFVKPAVLPPPPLLREPVDPRPLLVRVGLVNGFAALIKISQGLINLHPIAMNE